jgi:hypothetical protein
MAIDYLLTSGNVPALVVSGALHDPSLGLPATFFSQQPGVSATLSAGLRENATRSENIARYGTGAYSIGEGLDIVAGTGLTCKITPGAVILDGVVVKPDLGGADAGFCKVNLALANGARNFIWATASDIIALTGLSPPAGPAACLGSFLTAAGAISGNPDYSGRYEHRGPGLWRRTADAGVPADTPAARVMFVATTAGGTYLWTGAAWVQYATASGAYFLTGAGSPEGVVTAPVGTGYEDTTNGDLWVKHTGAGNTGWARLLRSTEAGAGAALASEVVGAPNITVGAEASNTIVVSVQFRDVDGNNISARMSCLAWLADSANAAPSTTIPDGGWDALTAGYTVSTNEATGAGGNVKELASGPTGSIGIDISHAAGARTWILHIRMGNQVYTGTVTFA